MYVYVRRIWLGDGQDVRLVSYQRDLGVWMLPGVRRIGFLLAIALKLNAVFVPSFFLFFFFFFFFLNHVIIDLGTKSCMQLARRHIKNLNSRKLTKEKNKIQTTRGKLSKRDHQNPVASPTMTNKTKVK